MNTEANRENDLQSDTALLQTSIYEFMITINPTKLKKNSNLTIENLNIPVSYTPEATMDLDAVSDHKGTDNILNSQDYIQKRVIGWSIEDVTMTSSRNSNNSIVFKLFVILIYPEVIKLVCFLGYILPSMAY